ncbi:MAG: alpha/beta hydrolase [Anaerolineales bacterium]|nr:alpha/beta hydrolase [Anaerolineales bacterium]
MPEASAAQRSTDRVLYSEERGWLTFTPAAGQPETGLIFYPGGRVPPAAYAPAAAALAERGYLAVIVPMPLNLAVLGADRAAAVQAAHPEITRWAIGGHSLGGAMAAQYAADHPGAVQGLLFWASYAPASLAGQNLRVVSVYGSLETGRASFTSPEARANLPAEAVFVEITGGNHEQFGYYTGQPNDPPAALPRADQQAQAVAAAAQLLEILSAAPAP